MGEREREGKVFRIIILIFFILLMRQLECHTLLKIGN